MADFPQVIRPESYSNGRGPQSGASDLTTAVSGTAHYNTKQENAANLPDALAHRESHSEMVKVDDK